MLSRNDWESEFFSRNIYILDVNEWDAEAFRKNIKQLAPDLVEAKVPLSRYSKITDLVTEGFVVVDTALNFVRKINNEVMPGNTYYVAGTEQMEELGKIAEDSIVYSRFDHGIFGSNARQRIYREWVTNAVKGEFDDLCLINRIEGVVAGFVTCRKEQDNCCQLGLLAVKEKFQGQGVGANLIKAAEIYAREEDCRDLKVSTQYSNRAAVGFYGKMGFMIDTIDLWLYRI